MVKARVNIATQTVLDAQQMYVKRLRETLGQYAQIPYMQQRIDPRTRDKQINMMSPEDMLALAQRDPQAAEAAAKRAEELRQKAEQNPPPFSAPGGYEE